MKWVGALSLLPPYIPLPMTLTLRSPGVRPGARASGKRLHGQGKGRALSQSFGRGGVGMGVPWAGGVSGVAGGPEFPSQGPKASRARGEGQAPCLATEKRRLGRQDAGLFTVRSPGPSKPPRGTRRLFTHLGGREPEARSSCPGGGGEGRPGSCSLSLGVQMETSYSRVSWRQRGGISCWSGSGWGREQCERGHPQGRGKTMGFLKITLIMRFGSHGVGTAHQCLVSLMVS